MTYSTLFSLFFLSLLSAQKQPGDERTELVVKLANELAAAILSANNDKILELTHPKALEALGGKEKARRTLGALMALANREAFALKSCKIGKPGEILTEGDTTFVVVPAVLGLQSPDGVLKGKSYLLGLSPDQGKSWTFIEGSSLENKAVRKILPKLPAKLRLPAIPDPQVVEGDGEREDERSVTIRKALDEVNEATFAGDYSKVIQFMHPKVLELMGGKLRAIATMRTTMGSLKDKGMETLSFEWGYPGKFLTEEGTTYVVIPNASEMRVPGGRLMMKSYNLGISADSGKSWTFINGDNLGKKEARDLVVPNLPASVILPEPRKVLLKDD